MMLFSLQAFLPPLPLLLPLVPLTCHAHTQPLTVTQIKKVQSLIAEASERVKTEIKETEEERHKHLVMIGNTLHPSVPISNDEVGSNWVQLSITPYCRCPWL